MFLQHWLRSKLDLFNGAGVEERSRKLYKNILNSVIIKVFSVGSTFYLIGLTIKSIDTYNYGVWLALTSVITWVNIFDIGLSHGLRNKVAEAFAIKDNQMAQKLISTTYLLMPLLVCPIWIISFFVYKHLNWQSLLNTNIDVHTLQIIVLMVFTSFCMQLILKPLSSILLADQKNFLVTVIQLVSNLLSVAAIFVFTALNSISLVSITAILGFSPVIVTLVYSIILFATKYRQIAPNIKGIDFAYKNDLLTLGAGFFIIQISGIIVYSSTNFLISHYFGPNEVTNYNIAFRYFSLISILHVLVISPFWTASTDAYTLGDFVWIKKMTKQMNYLCLGLTAFAFCMLLVSPIAYQLWIGKKLDIPFQLNTLMAISVVITLFSGTYNTFINGTGKIKLQTFYSVISAIIHLPLILILIKVFNVGINVFLFTKIGWASLAFLLWYRQFHVLIGERKGGKLWKG